MEVILKKKEDYDKMGVYLITNLINNKVYVGSTSDSFRIRWQAHINKLKTNKHPNAHLQSAFNKYGTHNFKITILEITLTRELSLEKEQYYLDMYKSYNREIGYNIEINVYRSEISEETKQKISNTLKEGYESGRITVSKNLNKIAGWNKGLKCPQISKTRREMFDSIKVFNINKELICTFRSCIDLCEWSENLDNLMPNIIISNCNKKGGILRKDKIYKSICEKSLYKGLYFEKCLPLSPEMGIAKWVNSKNAEMQILSQAEDISSEGATTTWAVQSA